MAGGLLLSPFIAEDLDYSASNLRLLTISLGVQAGVVGTNDFKVSAGSGLQVNVEKGKAFIEQTLATQESSNSFYNGLYNVLSPTEQNPYNSATVPTTNPQIAQIILRVYDINELKISGSTYGRIEWLNGTANAGATKAHVEAGEALSFGAAVLPQSSFRCAYVVVPKNATKSSEFEIVDARTFATPGRIISGRIESGTANPSSNEFKSEKLSTGEYKIKFSNILNTFPRIQLTLEYAGIATKTAYIKSVAGPPYTGFTMILFEGTSPVDGKVHFEAIG